MNTWPGQQPITMSIDSMSLFLDACGATGPLELAVEHPDGEEAEPRTFHQPFVLLGRAPETDIVLEHPAVSLRHAYLQLIAGRLFCIDLQSRTGIHWDGKPEPRGWVKEGQALGIGPFRVRYFGAGPSADEPRGGASALATSSPDSNHLPGLRLRLLNGAPRTNLSWQMQRVLALLGRSGSCKIRVIGPSVAMLHCS